MEAAAAVVAEAVAALQCRRLRLLLPIPAESTPRAAVCAFPED